MVYANIQGNSPTWKVTCPLHLCTKEIHFLQNWASFSVHCKVLMLSLHFFRQLTFFGTNKDITELKRQLPNQHTPTYSETSVLCFWRAYEDQMKNVGQWQLQEWHYICQEREREKKTTNKNT